MKTLILILIMAASAQNAYPQETARERIEQRRQSEAASSSSRQTLNNNQHQNRIDEIVENSRWSRIIYRYLDLTKPKNTVLYYPETPTDGEMNLFATIFTLMQNNNIKAYEYLDGREVFTDEYLVNFEEFTERFNIPEAEIPSQEVQSYYLKEVYYFDSATSSLRVQPLALCPIIHRHDNYQGVIRYPLFWVPYTQIAPYIKQMPTMLSDLNNSTIGSIDDFFITRKYHGEIYKTGNAGNLSIPQYTSSPEEMKAEQDRIEQELLDFETLLRQEEVNLHQQSNQSSVNQNSRRIFRSNRSASGATQTMRNRRY